MADLTDREVLERAAKAAGLPIEWDGDGFVIASKFRGHLTNYEPWNPLADDGDEARLEATLQLHINWHPLTEMVTVGTAEVKCSEPYGKDRQAARRRAGVRAAAAIAGQPAQGGSNG